MSVLFGFDTGSEQGLPRAPQTGLASRSCTIVPLPKDTLLSWTKGLKNQIAGQAKGSRAILVFNRPVGPLRQPSMGHSLLLSPRLGALPPPQPPKREPTTNSSTDLQGEAEPGQRKGRELFAGDM